MHTDDRDGLDDPAGRPAAPLLQLLGRAPLELLPTNEPHPSERQPAVAQPVEDTDGPVPDLPGTTGRPRTAAVASAISYMAVGALVTLVVLWATGTWANEVDGASDEVASQAGEPASRPDLPRTGAEAAAPARAGDAGSDAGREVVADVGRDADDQRPDPVQVEIPAIGVSAAVIPLGLDDSGALEVPEDFAQAGWWTGGHEPGEPGPAVIVGHVDSFQGPAVFFSLADLAHDDAIVVTRADGSSATFAVRALMRVDKAAFPTDLVYGPTDRPQLRLITCDGDFTDGSYLGNLIVTADLVREDPPPRSAFVS